MIKMLQDFTDAVREHFDPLANKKPDIEWVKLVSNPSLVAFTAQYSLRAAGKVSSISGQLFIKTKDGDVYICYADDPKRQWRNKSEGVGADSFKSAYLESIIDDALARGLKDQPSAHEIYNGIMGCGGPRWWTIWNGTDEDFAKIDDDYPTPPAGFDDTKSPQDFAESHPQFKAYLDRKGYGPFWYDRGYDAPTEEPKKPSGDHPEQEKRTRPAPFY